VGDFDHDRLPSRLSAILCEVFAPGWRQQCGASITEPGSLHSEAQTACRRLRPVARKREASKWCPATSLTYKLTSGLGGRRRISTQAPPPIPASGGHAVPEQTGIRCDAYRADTESVRTASDAANLINARDIRSRRRRQGSLGIGNVAASSQARRHRVAFNECRSSGNGSICLRNLLLRLLDAFAPVFHELLLCCTFFRVRRLRTLCLLWRS